MRTGTLLQLVIAGGLVVAACGEPAKLLRGNVEAINAPSLQVAGQVVVTKTTTQIRTQGGAQLKLAVLRIGDAVAVRGRGRSDGTIEADEIEVEGDEAEFSGAIAAIAAPNLTVAGRTVVTDAQTEIERDDAKITLADLHVGDVVEVEGTLQGDGSVLAREIQVQTGEQEEGEHGEVEFTGAIAAIASPNLTVAGRTVVTDANTEIKKDDTLVTLADLHVGDVVQVSGTLQADNSVLAKEIELEH